MCLHNVVVRTALLAGLAFAVASAVSGAPFTPGNMLLTGYLSEYTPQGSLVQRTTIPRPDVPDAGYQQRDVTVDPQGRAQVYNGTFAPYVSTYDPVAGTWAHHTVSGWTTINNIHYGGIGAYSNYVYVTNMATSGQNLRGMIRFDTRDWSATHFAGESDYIQLNIGKDGLLYGLKYGGSQLTVFDPITLAQIRSLTLARYVGNVTVASDGTMFGAGDRYLYRFTSTGGLDRSLFTDFYEGSDIDISTTGKIVACFKDGRTVISDTSLTGFTSFVAGNQGFVSFADRAVPEPSGLISLAVGLGVALSTGRRKIRRA
jgi:hypothetical protein